jgi:hypothetical protein
MPFGPMELLIVRFRDERPDPEVAQALRDLVESGTIRIVDLIFARKDADGNLTWSEPEAIAEAIGIAGITSDLVELLSERDVEALTAELPAGSSAGLMLFENAWAKRFADAVRASGGEMVLSERIPAFVVDEVLAAVADDASA